MEFIVALLIFDIAKLLYIYLSFNTKMQILFRELEIKVQANLYY